KYDLDAKTRILFEQSPSPDGIIGPIEPESWGVAVIIAIRGGHLVIEYLLPKFPPESYSFAIASPEAVDKLLAAASPAQEQSKSPPAPPDPEKWLTSVQAEFAQVSRKKDLLGCAIRHIHDGAGAWRQRPVEGLGKSQAGHVSRAAKKNLSWA